MSTPSRTPDPMPQHPPEVERFIEWQTHQYDVGYWTGGRIPPLYRADRPNRFGWALVVGGLMPLAAVLGGAAMADDRAAALGQMARSPEVLLVMLVAALGVASGVRLVRGPRRRAPRV